MNPEAKILVAGHRGMVGSAITRSLKAHGYGNLLLRTRAELDLTRQQETEDFFCQHRPDYVFLAAAKVGGIFANSTYTGDFIYQNIMIAANVVQASYRSGVKKLLNLGSTCIYPKHAAQPMKEEALLSGYLEPTNEAYAIAKISAIKLCRYFNQQWGTNFLSVMPTNLYGPNDTYHFENSHVLPAFIRKFHLAKLLRGRNFSTIREDFHKHGFPRGLAASSTDDEIARALGAIGVTGDSVTLWGSGAPFRELLFADDLAEACVFLMQKFNAAEVGEFVNIGTGQDFSIREIAGMVKDTVGFSGEICWDSSKPDGTPRKLSDITRINNLGWRARVELPDGIRLVYRQYEGSEPV